MRALFVYWKVPRALADDVAASARAWQHSLRLQHPALEATLFRRTDAAAIAQDSVTLMEVFAMPGGVAPALDAALLQAGDHALLAFGAPPRHVEVFDALPR
jgi:hypothetical protein